MRRFRAAALFPLAAGLAACAHLGSPPTPAPAPPGVTLAMDVGERGEVVFQVPNGWKATSDEPDPPMPGSVRFEPPSGHFIIVVTPLWGPGQPTEPLGPEVARVLVEAGRDRALQGSVERDLPVRPLEPPGLRGWYFSATDRELAEAKRLPGPDQYRCLVQGAAVAGPLVLAFTLLDDGDGPQRELALALVRGATHRPVPASDPPAPPSEPTGRTHADPSTWAIHGDEPMELGLPGKAWSLLLDLPGWSVKEPMRRFDGSGVSVIGQRQADGLILSVAMVDSQGRRSPESCRDPDWSRIGKLAGVGDARFEVSAGEARAWYTVRDEGPPTRHLSAWRYRDGACIHLHLSLPGAEPGVDARLQRALGAARFGEAL
jgi:hypothetical protein